MTTLATSERAGPQLKRTIGPVLLTLYGVGVMVGAGIYVLVGEVAGNAGVFAPVAFLLAGLVAAPTAVSYAELSTRVPEAAGEAAFVRKAFNSANLSMVIGLAIVAVGVTSAAAVLEGGVGYLTDFAAADAVPSTLWIVGIGVALAIVAMWGVLESLAVAAVFTVLEVIGLIVVVRAGWGGPASTDWAEADLAQLRLGGLGLAVVLAFFAFIGFEDMVNMVEEVKRPARTMPIAILASLVVTSLLYGAVSFATVRTVEVDRLADSDRPLALVYETATGGDTRFLSAIAVVAALNGVLAQIVMAARVLFGLGRTEGPLTVFHRASGRFGTPILATVTSGGLTILLALSLDLGALAEITSTFLLAVFVTVNVALIALKRRSDSPGFTAPHWIPWVGLVGAAAALVVSLVT